MGLSELESARTARQQVLIGQDAQVALNRAHVLIVGAGGLGCPVLQQLAAAGIGHITLIDDDEVALSNIHRQVLFGVDDVGQPKAAVAARRATSYSQRYTFRRKSPDLAPTMHCDCVRTQTSSSTAQIPSTRSTSSPTPARQPRLRWSGAPSWVFAAT